MEGSRRSRFFQPISVHAAEVHPEATMNWIGFALTNLEVSRLSRFLQPISVHPTAVPSDDELDWACVNESGRKPAKPLPSTDPLAQRSSPSPRRRRTESGLRPQKNLGFAEGFLSLQAVDLASTLSSAQPTITSVPNKSRGSLLFDLHALCHRIHRLQLFLFVFQAAKLDSVLAGEFGAQEEDLGGVVDP